MSKIELNYDINKFDFEVVKSYLKEVQKRSNGSYRNQKHVILELLNTVNKNIEKITIFDVKNYFESVLDKKNIKLDSKDTYRSYLIKFFYFVQTILLNKGIDFKNPVPIKKIFKFTKREGDYKRISEEENNIFSKNELIEILESSKKTNFRDFIIFSILIVAGMRISEALTIKVENVNLEERYIETGFVKDARKSDKSLLFFFPKNFKPFLEKYIRILNRKSGWLFPGRTYHLDKNYWYKRVKNKYGSKFSKSHSFRRTLITNRVKMECKLLISEMLMNHESSSVEGKSYVKLSIKEKRNFYDKYFPYSEFPYF